VPESEGISIEVVAADAARRSQCCAALGAYGFRVSGTASLEEAMGVIERRPTDHSRPSLFVLVGMGVDGARAAMQELRGHPWTAPARVLVVDEALTPEQALALQDDGAANCYIKPFLAPVYSARVRGALRG